MKISLIGYGSVTRPFALGMKKSGAEVVAVGLDINDHTKETAVADRLNISTIDDITLDSDLVVLGVPDKNIYEVSNKISARFNTDNSSTAKPVVLHFAGSLGLEPLNPLRDKGCPGLAWHPVQTFTQGVGPERFNGISAGTTADPEALNIAEDIARRLKVTNLIVEESDRGRYHQASVLISNFIPVFADLAADRLEGIVATKEDVVKVLMPLLKGMVSNLESLDIPGSITGPVPRGDIETFKSHLENWNDEDGREVYLKMTEALVRLAEKSGRISSEMADNWYTTLKEE